MLPGLNGLSRMEPPSQLLRVRKGWTPRDKFFWWTLAADQTSHHVTYVALAAVVVIWAN